MKFRWSLAPAQTSLIEQLCHQTRFPLLLAQCLANRAITSASAATHFLQPRLKQLSDPFLLPDMDAAVARLWNAHERGESLVIFGDYDVDGVTSTALLVEVLTALGWKVHYYLPHRMDEGYGLSREGVENCLNKFPVSLLLAVDCGSTATETIQCLHERGVDVLVLDHHQVACPLPPAVALVNPHRLAPGHPDGSHALTDDSRKDFRSLCSVGLAFKLAHAIVKRGRQLQWPSALNFDLRPLLDLVALGTIADLVPLTGENRILTSTGLERLNQTQRPGLVALKQVAQVRAPIGVYEVGFQLAPRLNAAGRLENAERALHLLLAKTIEEAEPIARELDAQNRERQQIERRIADEVIGALKARVDANCFAIVEGQMLWHIGVVGIVASRVLREFYRPTIILGGDAESWRGSGRSIEGFDLAEALRDCSDLLLRHGGHALAAGLSIKEQNLEAFRQRLNLLARQRLKPEQLRPLLQLDAEVKLGDLTLELLRCLRQLGPHGQGNPEVQLLVRKVRLQRPPQCVGKDQQHVKWRVTDGQVLFEALWWNGAEAPQPSGHFDLAFIPQINEYNGSLSVQLKVLDWREPA